jgi:hypothetical protein
MTKLSIFQKSKLLFENEKIDSFLIKIIILNYLEISLYYTI